MPEASPPPYLSYRNGTIAVCIYLPPKVNSPGIWSNATSPSEILSFSLPLLEMQLLLMFLITHFVYAIFKPLGVTFFASQMFVQTFKNVLFTPGLSLDIVQTIAGFGFSIFLFLMAVKMDAREVLRSTRRAKVIGIVSLLSPMVIGLIVYQSQSDKLCIMERMIGTIIESMTSFSVVAWLLDDLKIGNTELGRLALSSSTVCNMCSICLITFVSLTKHLHESTSNFVKYLGITILFIIFLFVMVRPLMFWIIKETPEGRPVRETHIVIVIMVAIGCSTFTNWFNQSPLLGAFLVGLAIPDGPPLGSALVDKFDCFARGVFLVAFVTTTTMKVNPNKVLSDPEKFNFSIVFVVSTFIAKFLSCFIASFWDMMPLRDASAFSLIMSSKGVVELQYFASYRGIQILSESTFTVLALSILVNATLIPIIVKILYDPVSKKYAGYQKRNLIHLKPDAELRVLACIHGSESARAMIDILDLTCPTKESPNVVYVLHLIELIGRDSPIFIAHQKLDNKVVTCHENILAFNHYSEKNGGLVTVNAFTAISPPKLMHEDICTMALDKQTSLLLLPFHKKWTMDGTVVENENTMIRNLNFSVLHQAPCSIGILVGCGLHNWRRKLMKSSKFCSIGMIFLGGTDDREALVLAKRMARDPKVKLTLIHLIPDQEPVKTVDWDMMLDVEMLKDFKENEVGDGCNITFTQQVSNDGKQTAKFVRSLTADYDLIIIGRRCGLESVQTTGLSEWCEYPELGVIGDLLASMVLDSRVFVLVVQQQLYIY
ncbi:hypothetical protein F3Y22_tig00110634pilonHSYRG00026 [Hibiscus syriacus]|uniref:Uncharacterized protein n=1 Tax=Hibiscus syriacus TaxID=106335 RepID=A0A6A3A1A1_HIBSY|nr:hypothetical protein F3Y22_tig00110634pilonHSYRG00026 [Hibiscus syriacus]